MENLICFDEGNQFFFFILWLIWKPDVNFSSISNAKIFIYRDSFNMGTMNSGNVKNRACIAGVWKQHQFSFLCLTKICKHQLYRLDLQESLCCRFTNELHIWQNGEPEDMKHTHLHTDYLSAHGSWLYSVLANKVILYKFRVRPHPPLPFQSLSIKNNPYIFNNVTFEHLKKGECAVISG